MILWGDTIIIVAALDVSVVCMDTKSRKYVKGTGISAILPRGVLKMINILKLTIATFLFDLSQQQ